MVACPAKHPLHPTSNCYKKAIVRACCDRLREIEGRLEQSVGPRFEQQLQSCDDLCGVARLILMLQRRTELRDAESGWLEELAQLSPAEVDENPPKLALQLRRRLEELRACVRPEMAPSSLIGATVLLAVLVLASFFTSEVIAANEDVLQRVVLLAAFIPLLGGTGGNVGAQSSTVVIRGLSTQSISSLGPLRAIGREAMAGALLGVLMMLLVVPFAWWRGESALVGLSVGMSLLAITTLAATAGAAFPLLFDRMGLDPALMSTPFITTCTDVAGTLIYLKTAGWLLVHLPQLVQAAGISTHFFATGVF